MNQNIKWLTTEQVILINKKQIEIFGGLGHGIRDEVGLEATVFRPQQVFYYEPNSSIFVLAAYYCNLSKAHCFLDANKRTAINACLSFLLLNNIELNTEQEHLLQLIIDFTTNKLSTQQLSNQLKKLT